MIAGDDTIQVRERMLDERLLANRDLTLLDAYWRAANYLSVGQIYLLDNPLMREPLRIEHIKPRLLATGARRLVSTSPTST